MTASNLPPGVTGGERQVAGEPDSADEQRAAANFAHYILGWWWGHYSTCKRPKKGARSCDLCHVILETNAEIKKTTRVDLVELTRGALQEGKEHDTPESAAAKAKSARAAGEMFRRTLEPDGGEDHATDEKARPCWLYLRSERESPGLWTVGFYRPTGEWEPESDHATPKAAAERVRWLNGEKAAGGA